MSEEIKVFIDPSSNFHPYECIHDQTCIHCAKIKTENHNPEKCALCNCNKECQRERT